MSRGEVYEPFLIGQLYFQVLDVSFNRIRELNQNSFARYTDVKYLYLFENMIQIIEVNTFAQLTNLEVSFELNYSVIGDI